MATNHSKETIDVVRAAMALAQRDVDLGLATVEEIQSIPKTRFAPAERNKIIAIRKAEGKTNREVAEETGVDQRTVGRVYNRQRGANAPKNGANAPTKGSADPIENGKAEANKTAFLHRAELVASYAVYSGKVDQEVCRAARAAALAWDQLAKQMEGSDGQI